MCVHVSVCISQCVKCMHVCLCLVCTKWHGDRINQCIGVVDVALKLLLESLASKIFALSYCLVLFVCFLFVLFLNL